MIFTPNNDLVSSLPIQGMTIEALAGNDTLVIIGSGSQDNFIYGESKDELSGAVVADDDTLIVDGSDNSNNVIVGDAENLVNNARGGDDLLFITGDNNDNNKIFGDAEIRLSNTTWKVRGKMRN